MDELLLLRDAIIKWHDMFSVVMVVAGKCSNGKSAVSIYLMPDTIC
jgi:hypothetical protein